MRAFDVDPDILAETPRLILRWPRRTDAARLVPLLNDWEVARWLANVPFPFTSADGRGWVRLAEMCRHERDVFVLVVARRDDGEPIGGAELNLFRRETGYWIGTRFQGRGYGKETLLGLLRLAFDEHRLPNLTATAMPENQRSRGLLLSCGFRLRGIEPFDFGLRGGVLPGCVHTMSAEDWRRFKGEPA